MTDLTFDETVSCWKTKSDIMKVRKPTGVQQWGEKYRTAT